MARFRTLAALWTGQQRIPAGRTVADSQANAVVGDFVWLQLNAQSLPAAFVPLDSSAQVMRDASQWKDKPFPATILGIDSIDG
jgi:hypothetical protein